MLHRKSQVGPALLSGGLFYQQFGEFAKVNGVVLSTDLDAQLNSSITVLSGQRVTAHATIVSGNTVRVNVEKQAAFLSGDVWVVAVSGNIIANTFNIIADGE